MKPILLSALLFFSTAVQAQSILVPVKTFKIDEGMLGAQLRVEWEPGKTASQMAKAIVDQLKSVTPAVSKDSDLKVAWPKILKDAPVYLSNIETSLGRTVQTSVGPFLVQVVNTGEGVVFQMSHLDTGDLFSIDISAPNTVWWKTREMQIPYPMQY